MHRIYIAILSSVFVLSACGGGGAGILKKTAAVDLNCPAKQLEAEELQRARNGTIWKVYGCGKTAQYNQVKKTVTRASEVSDYTPPPPPAPPPPVVAEAPAPQPQQPQGGFTPEQRAQFFSDFEQKRQQRLADQQAFFDNAGKKPSAFAAAPAPAPQPAPPQAEPARAQPSNDQVGWVCITGDYYTCPSVSSTTALGGYAKCRMTCMMSGKCSSCVVGEGEKCSRVPSRDSECPK